MVKIFSTYRETGIDRLRNGQLPTRHQECPVVVSSWRFIAFPSSTRRVASSTRRFKKSTHRFESSSRHLVSSIFVVLRVRLITEQPASSSFVVMPFRRFVMTFHRPP